MTLDPHVIVDTLAEGRLYSIPYPKVAIVPIPSYVRVARVTATSGGYFLSSGNAYGGAVCKNVLFSVGNGQKLIVALDQQGAVFFGTLKNADEREASLNPAQLDIAVFLRAASNSQFIAYRRGVAMMSINTTSVPTLRPFLGGSLMTGYGNATTAGTSNPISPQIRATSSSGRNPSMLFGGPLGRGNYFTGGVPGSTQAETANANSVSTPSYICVEWME
jgi:hypothetical protein